MPTYSENLITIRDQIAANLVEMTEDPKPTYTIGDETYQWGELFKLYTDQLKSLNELIEDGEPVSGSQVYEFRTRRIVR